MGPDAFLRAAPSLSIPTEMLSLWWMALTDADPKAPFADTASELIVSMLAASARTDRIPCYGRQPSNTAHTVAFQLSNCSNISCFGLRRGYANSVDASRR